MRLATCSRAVLAGPSIFGDSGFAAQEVSRWA
jgi:hypothetical protein